MTTTTNKSKSVMEPPRALAWRSLWLCGYILAVPPRAAARSGPTNSTCEQGNPQSSELYVPRNSKSGHQLIQNN